MEARSVASWLSGLIGVALLAAPAHAAVETFSFVSGSYMFSGSPGPVDASVTGTFSGNVEGDGYIELADLVSFNAAVHINYVYSLSGPLDLSDLTLFSYNTLGGAASLSLEGAHSSPDISGSVCMGAPAALDPKCASGSTNPIAMFSYSWSNLPPPAVGVGVIVHTTVAPTITLVSAAAAPEPATWALMALGFAGLGLVGRARSASARTAPARRRT